MRSAPRGVGPCEHPRACCWESPGRIWWGPQRLQVWALGLQAAVGCLQPPCTIRSFHSWESWPEQVVSCKEGVKGYTCPSSGGRKFSSETQLSFGDSPVGRQGVPGREGDRPTEQGPDAGIVVVKYAQPPFTFLPSGC